MIDHGEANVRPGTRRHPLVLCAYLGAFVALDRVSAADALSGAGFPLWNPAPACSLALLLTYGLRFAPLVLAAASSRISSTAVSPEASGPRSSPTP